MLKKAKIFFGLTTAFLLLVIASPFFATLGLADDVDTVQVVNSGTLSFVDIPDNFSFGSLLTTEDAQSSTYIPDQGSSSTGDIIVQDLRFSGGFSLTMQATAFENQFNDVFECADFAVVTFNTDDPAGVVENANVIPDTPGVTATYDGDPGTAEDYTAMTPTGDDPTICEPLEILSATANDAQGRIGSWKFYPAYKLNVPAFAPPGTYSSTITFTLVDDTTVPSPFGDGFAITSSTPVNGGIAYHQSGSDGTSFITAYNVPSYNGASQVDVQFQICDSSDFDNCYNTSLDDIYSMVSTDGGGAAFRFNKDYVAGAVASLGIPDPGTIYHRLRLLESGGETVISDNYYTFVVIADPVDGPTDAWDPADDDRSGTPTDLGTPTAVTQTHGPHTLSDADYYDWFAFTLTNGQSYNFAGTSGTGDTYALLYNGMGTFIDNDDDSGEDTMFSLDYTASYTGTHYLAVRCKLIGTDCGYTLSYADTTGSGDQWDPDDDTGAGATAMGTPPFGSATHGPHTLSDTDLYDWFAFDLVSGSQFTFTATNGSGDTYGQLYSDSSGSTQVAFDDDSAGSLMFRIIYTPSSDGTYYLRVRCYSVGASCGYTLQTDR